MKFKLSTVIFLLFMFLAACNAQNKEIHEDLEGNWAITWQSNDIGVVRTFLEFRTDKGHFNAFSRKQASKDMLGSLTSLLARTFTKNFKNGSILRVENGTYELKNDTLQFKGVFTSVIGNYLIQGYVLNGKLTARLTDRTQRIRGTIYGSRDTMTRPLEDYPALFEKIVQVTNENIFNNEVLLSKEWKAFEKNMRKVSAKAQDDLEMVAAFFYYARKLPVSHFYLMKTPPEEKEPAGYTRKPYAFLEEQSTHTAYLKITSFSGPPAEIDSIFAIIRQKNYNNLIVDLRNNSGGSIEAGLTFAQYLFDSTFYGGIFLTRKWFDQHKEPPTADNYTNFPHFTEANFDLLFEGIHHTEGLCLKIIPKETTYNGKVYILTNKRTASTCEPIVYGLKQKQRAVVVGEPTAGAMLSSELFELDHGFKLYIPTADYYTSDGFRIDQKGVQPDIRVKQEDALEYVIKNLIK